MALAVTGLVLAGGSASSEAGPEGLPPEADSAQVSRLLETFPGGDLNPGVVVFSRADGAPLAPEDLTAAVEARERMLAIDRGVAEPQQGETNGPAVVPSEDGRAALGVVPISGELSGLELTDTVAQIREAGADGLPQPLVAEVTGGAGFAADVAGAFAGADVRLLAATAAVVAVLLLLTYRSPILWLVPLLVVAVSDRVGTVLAGRVAEASGFTLDGSTTGITSVLVFGAGTNYALLIVSRYREELRRHEDHRVALARAVEHAGPAVLASNVTVVLALLALLLATLPNTQVLGLSGAVGLIVAALFAIFVLPPTLALAGRTLFWPFVPQVGEVDRSTSGAWYRLGRGVARRPVVVLAATVPILAVCGAALLGVNVGLAQTDQFRGETESVRGFETLKTHFGGGQANPAVVVADTDAAAQVTATASSVDGVVRALPTGDNGDGLTRWQVVLDADPATEQAFDVVRNLRTALATDAPEANALVGGPDAQDLERRTASAEDLKLLAPLILALVLGALFVLLRSLVAPIVLILTTTLSALAAIGAGFWVNIHLLGFPAIDTTVPLFAFLFLVALGVDYTIFLVIRAREETPEHGTTGGMVRAVALTGGVITSAGIVLAAVFAVLGVLPLVPLMQLGIVVGIGILLDTFVVRTVVIPALFTLLGPAVWWPSKLSSTAERGDEAPGRLPATPMEPATPSRS